MRIHRFCLLLAALSPTLAAAAPPTSVLLIGDSITSGNVSAPSGLPYGFLLGNLLGADYEVTNIGCSGTSSLDWTISSGNALCETLLPPTIYEYYAGRHLPTDVVTVLLGTNDATGAFEKGWAVAPADYAYAIRELTSNLRADGAKWVVLMPPPPLYFDGDAVAARIAGYRDAVLAICSTSAGVVCGPDVTTLLLESDFQSGNRHPNRSGHVKIATELFDAITALPIREPAAGARVATGLVLLATGLVLLEVFRRRRARPRP